MAPEREKYLAKCSKREKILRAFITNSKIEIRILKQDLKSEHRYSRDTNLLLIRHEKIQLNAYRHELARLRGMDRVVVPRRAYIGVWGDKGGLCKCEKHITDAHDYCPTCGRKILWEKIRNEFKTRKTLCKKEN